MGTTLLSAAQAAGELGISKSRMLALLKAGRVKAERVGQVWIIPPTALEAVRVRKKGRPKKPA